MKTALYWLIQCVWGLPQTLLGPAYLIVIGIGSTLWGWLPSLDRMRREKQVSYFAFFTEKWANACGERVTGRKSMEQLIIN